MLVWALVSCQRLDRGEHEIEVARLTDASDESNGTYVSDGPPGDGVYVCAQPSACECYGDGAFCDGISFPQQCEQNVACEDVDPGALAACLVAFYCDGTGSFSGDSLVCDRPAACTGRCDRGPTACDADGDGVLRFPCGPEGLTCAAGQYCVRTSVVAVCGPECSDCTYGGGDYVCGDAVDQCPKNDLPTERACIAARWCRTSTFAATGHEIVCDDVACGS